MTICQYCKRDYDSLQFGADIDEDIFKQGCYDCWCEYAGLIDDGMEPQRALEEIREEVSTE